MVTSTVNLVKLEPSSGMHLRNIHTCEVYADFIFLAKSLSANDFEEITDEEYQPALRMLKNRLCKIMYKPN